MQANEFGEYLRDLRKERNLTIRQIEAYSGVSNSYLSQLENGKRGIPSPEILQKLAPVLKVSYETLMEKAGYLGRSDIRNPHTDLYEPTPQEIENVIREYDLQFDGAPLTEQDKEEVLEFVRLVLKRRKKKAERTE